VVRIEAAYVREAGPVSLDRMTPSGASFPLGATCVEGGAVFRVWAPACRTVEIVIDGRRPTAMTRREEGVWELRLPDVPTGTRYQYRLNGDRYRPDPTSRWQPEGVHGRSVLVDPQAFTWTDEGFRGHAVEDLVVYELHVGTFTPVGTFDAVISRLPALVELGVTAVELMPIAEFPGSRNWGYDGVHLFAPQSTYGGPAGLRRLVDACHAHGLSVMLDLVYNHLGPEGNYLAEFGPYFTDRYQTPWGTAVNFDGPDGAGVRRHFVENGRAWVREFHVDGFRMDAIHSIFDASPLHILTEIAEAARAEAARLGRPLHVMVESHDNDRRIVLPPEQGGLGLDGVWSDDFHHAIHVTLTGEAGGYYADFNGPAHLARTLSEGFAFQGDYSQYFERPRGTPSADLPASRFVICIQNHDQVGNRAQGDRIGALVPLAAVKLAAGLMFAAPAIPLLFMGEEYGETSPFQFFTSFLDRDLAEAVRRGRTEEFKRFAWQGDVPDPGEPGTFLRSRLNHTLAGAPRHRELREYYRHWLALRRRHPALGARGKEHARAELDGKGAVLTLTRGPENGPRVRVVANLTPTAVPLEKQPEGWRVLLDSNDTKFAGTGTTVPLQPFQLLLYEASG
jgi:maltooligosyltrehalose trehalohydrolase